MKIRDTSCFVCFIGARSSFGVQNSNEIANCESVIMGKST